ncbi:hypothetical protein LINPERPRIM_LOCUS2009 [Linum perenne]
MKKVPPVLVNTEGVSWLASQIGRTINKFVRDGLDVKVCIVNDVTEDTPNKIVVDVCEEKVAEIVIEVPQTRTYKETNGGGKKWVVKQADPHLNSKGVGSSSIRNVPETLSKVEGTFEIGFALPIGGGAGKSLRLLLKLRGYPLNIVVMTFLKVMLS